MSTILEYNIGHAMHEKERERLLLELLSDPLHLGFNCASNALYCGYRDQGSAYATATGSSSRALRGEYE